MLDLRRIGDNVEETIKTWNTGGNFDYLKEVPLLINSRRELILKGDELKATRNQTSRKIEYNKLVKMSKKY